MDMIIYVVSSAVAIYRNATSTDNFPFVLGSCFSLFFFLVFFNFISSAKLFMFCFALYLFGFILNITGVFGYTIRKLNLSKIGLKAISTAIAIVSKASKQNQDTMVINGNIATLTYRYAGHSYLIRMPYNSKLKAIATNISFFLIKGEEKVDITQQSGTTYNVTAAMLGGSEIWRKNNISGEIRKFGPDEIPLIR
jgi:hypothetical protein